MAGTPTPNYNFPTYAETDVPDLAGAYNQAVNAIDAKIKEVADTIPSDVDVPDANSTTKGIAKLYDSSSIGDSTQEDGGVTPAAMKDYVDEKVPVEQQTYTGNAPIVVDASQRKISINDPSIITKNAADAFVSAMQTNANAYLNYAGSSLPTVDQAAAVKTIIDGHTVENNWPAARVVPTLGASQIIAREAAKTMLTSSDAPQTTATTPLTTEMLANLYVTPSGMVVYKAPSE